MGSKLVAITAIGSRLILVICSPGELPDLGQVQAERVDPGQIRGRGIVGRSAENHLNQATVAHLDGRYF